MTSAESPIIDHDAAEALLVGPESACWRYASDARLYLVMLYPLLLPVAHPTVAAAGRRLRALHKGFRGQRGDGQRYCALEPRAYAWVHATLLHTYVAEVPVPG